MDSAALANDPAGDVRGLANPAPGAGVQAQIQVLRERGAGQLDPMRLRFIEALARRAATGQGLLRQSLDNTLARAIAACAAQCDGAGLAQQAAAARRPRPATPGLLGQLVADIDALGGAPTPQSAGESGPQALHAPSLDELQTVQRFRATWARLSVERQLGRSLDRIPDNPGPLNSHLLVLRALRRMQELSPVYLEQFVAHAEALWWLDRARASAPADKRNGPVTVGKRKTRAGRSA